MVRTFQNLDTYCNYYDEHEQRYNDVDIVDGPYVISADGQFECKSYKTALRRFFKALEGKFDNKGFDEACLLESISYGVWKDAERYWEDGKGVVYHKGGWHYAVEEVAEGIWYIEVTVGKEA